MSKTKLTDRQLQFVDELALLLGAWSMPANAARLYGYLQIMNEPVSLDDIARDLEISRSHAHTAAKLLDDYGNARRLSVRGSKRALYVASDDPGAPLRRQSENLGKLAARIMADTAEVADGEAATRLARLANFHRKLKAAMDEVIQPERDAEAA